jgi:hypothetical protein
MFTPPDGEFSVSDILDTVPEAGTASDMTPLSVDPIPSSASADNNNIPKTGALFGKDSGLLIAPTGPSLLGNLDIFKYANDSWIHLETMLTPEPEYPNYFGDVVSANSDLSVLAVTASPPTGIPAGDFGRVYIYERSGDTYNLVYSVTPSETSNSIGISESGTELIIASRNNIEHHEFNGTWGLKSTIVKDSGLPPDLGGASTVNIYRNDLRMIHYDSGRRKVYLYSRSPGANFSLKATISTDPMGAGTTNLLGVIEDRYIMLELAGKYRLYDLEMLSFNLVTEDIIDPGVYIMSGGGCTLLGTDTINKIAYISHGSYTYTSPTLGTSSGVISINYGGGYVNDLMMHVLPTPEGEVAKSSKSSIYDAVSGHLYVPMYGDLSTYDIDAHRSSRGIQNVSFLGMENDLFDDKSGPYQRLQGVRETEYIPLTGLSFSSVRALKHAGGTVAILHDSGLLILHKENGAWTKPVDPLTYTNNFPFADYGIRTDVVYSELAILPGLVVIADGNALDIHVFRYMGSGVWSRTQELRFTPDLPISTSASLGYSIDGSVFLAIGDRGRDSGTGCVEIWPYTNGTFSFGTKISPPTRPINEGPVKGFGSRVVASAYSLVNRGVVFTGVTVGPHPVDGSYSYELVAITGIDLRGETPTYGYGGFITTPDEGGGADKWSQVNLRFHLGSWYHHNSSWRYYGDGNNQGMMFKISNISTNTIQKAHISDPTYLSDDVENSTFGGLGSIGMLDDVVIAKGAGELSDLLIVSRITGESRVFDRPGSVGSTSRVLEISYAEGHNEASMLCESEQYGYVLSLIEGNEQGQLPISIGEFRRLPKARMYKNTNDVRTTIEHRIWTPPTPLEYLNNAGTDPVYYSGAYKRPYSVVFSQYNNGSNFKYTVVDGAGIQDPLGVTTANDNVRILGDNVLVPRNYNDPRELFALDYDNMNILRFTVSSTNTLSSVVIRSGVNPKSLGVDTTWTSAGTDNIRYAGQFGETIILFGYYTLSGSSTKYFYVVRINRTGGVVLAEKLNIADRAYVGNGLVGPKNATGTSEPSNLILTCKGDTYYDLRVIAITVSNTAAFGRVIQHDYTGVMYDYASTMNGAPSVEVNVSRHAPMGSESNYYDYLVVAQTNVSSNSSKPALMVIPRIGTESGVQQFYDVLVKLTHEDIKSLAGGRIQIDRISTSGKYFAVYNSMGYDTLRVLVFSVEGGDLICHGCVFEESVDGEPFVDIYTAKDVVKVHIYRSERYIAGTNPRSTSRVYDVSTKFNNLKIPSLTTLP